MIAFRLLTIVRIRKYISTSGHLHISSVSVVKNSVTLSLILFINAMNGKSAPRLLSAYLILLILMQSNETSVSRGMNRCGYADAVVIKLGSSVDRCMQCI